MSVQKRYAGRTDVPLTEVGVQQAAAAAKRLASAGRGGVVEAPAPAAMADPEAAPPGGESFTDVSARVTAALDRVLAARAGQTVLIVSHVTPIKMLIAAA